MSGEPHDESSDATDPEPGDANLTAGTRQGSAQHVASNVFDLYVSPIISGYHFSQTEQPQEADGDRDAGLLTPLHSLCLWEMG
ncbi:hypothetical protein [Variovorax rhizosphaerae]|uniref:Uncharacterized protein n=1 Tax=Variovorax rhizosphaerae TaxID=1836200 RepID=A0ABU8WJ96_9BURK